MRRLLLTISLSMLAATGAYAVGVDGEAEADTTATAYSLDEVVITGTRTPKSLKDTPVQTRLITASELRMADATNLQDLLQQEMPGIEFTYAMNQQINMNLAGFSGLGVLILVDGERLAGETMDNVDFSRLPMHNVERIEIIRGAASALYGSNAAGGVINIITKKPERKWSANLNVRGGAHDEWRAGGSLGLKFKHVSNMLDVGYDRMGAFDVCLDNSDACDFRHVSAYQTWNVSDRFVYTPFDNLKLSARAGYYYKERLYNVDVPNRYRGYTGAVNGEWRISDDEHLEVGYLYDRYDKSDYMKVYRTELLKYSNDQHSVKALYSRNFRSSDVLTVGGDMMRDWLLSYQFAEGETHSQYSADLFAQYDATITDRLELVGAVRWDWFSDHAVNCVTPKLSVRFRPGRVTLRAGYSGGFRAPTLKEKYMNFNMADIFDIHGNANLKPEKSHNFNLSAEYAWRNYYFTASGYYNIVKNKIGTSGILYDAAHDPYIRYLNVEDLKVFGVDATIKARWTCGISASVSYNFTHEQTHVGSVTQYCPARPHSVVAKVSWQHSWREGFDFGVNLSGRVLSSVTYKSMYMYEPFEPFDITNPAYTLWKLQLSQSLFSGARLTVTVDNLLNYRPRVYSFNAPVTTGTTLQIGLDIDIDKFLK